MPLPATSSSKQYPSDFFTGGSLAYLVGMNGYRYVPALDSPANDCRGMEEVLSEKHGFTTVSLLDAERQGVLDLLDQVQRDCKPDSRVIFYYAGHGIADGSDDEHERPKGFLLAVDSERGKEETYIEMGHVLEVLVGLPCSHLLIILDCCYAGAIRYAEQTRSIGSSVPKTLYAEKFTYYINNPAKQVITSAACDQKAVDALGSRGALNENHRSPFAESLIRNLEQGDQDWSFGHIEPDGIITGSELGYFLSMEVSDRLSKNKVPFAEQQTPSAFRIGERTKGEFIFVSSQKAILQLKPNPKENPWKGLADYSVSDNHLFYGRQRVLDGWWEGKVQYKGLLQLARPGENHKVLVTGRSGSGKSSLVKAGVLARLEDESPGSVTIITPGSTPMATHGTLLNELEAKAGPVYLMVDQYEELVTVCSDAREQEDFEARLARIAAKEDALVIITLRSDLERRFVGSPFMDNVYRFVVPPFTREEIREVVLQPAIQQLLEFRGSYSAGSGDTAKSQDQADERFVNRIIDETFANPDSLPLLSFALNRLYEKKDPDPGSPLLEKDYDEFGGISGILDSKLTEAYDTYDMDNQALFRQLIYRMISFDAGYMAKRRVYTTYHVEEKTLNELKFSNPLVTSAMNAIRETLVKQRLLKTSGENEVSGTEATTIDDNVYFEPAHEALLNSSNLIAQWQKEQSQSSDGLNFQSRVILLNALSAGAKNFFFYQGRKKRGGLWKDDPRLDQVKKLWNGKVLALNETEEAFVEQSLRAELRATILFWSVLIVVFSVISIAGIYSYIQKLKAQDQLAESYFTQARTAKDVNDLVSLLYTAEALTINSDTAKKQAMLLNVNKAIPDIVLAHIIPLQTRLALVDMTPDGRSVLTVSDGHLQLWDVGTGTEKSFPVDTGVYFAHFVDSTGKMVTIENGEVALRSPDGAKKVLISKVALAGLRPGIQYAHLSQDGRLLTVGSPNTVCSFELTPSSWRRHKPIHFVDNIDYIRFRMSPDGRRMLVGGDEHTINLYNAVTGTRLISRSPTTIASWSANHNLTALFIESMNLESELFILDDTSKRGSFKKTESFKVTSSHNRALLMEGDQLVLLGNDSTMAFHHIHAQTKYPDMYYNMKAGPDALSTSPGDGSVMLQFDELTKFYRYEPGGHDVLKAKGYIVNSAARKNVLPIMSLDGNVIAAAGDRCVYLYSYSSKQKHFLGGEEKLDTILFSPGKNFAAGMEDENHVCHLWNMTKGESFQLSTVRLNRGDELKFSSRTAVVVYAKKQRFFLYDFGNHVRQELGNAHFWLNPFSADGKQIIYMLEDGSAHRRAAPGWADQRLFNLTSANGGKVRDDEALNAYFFGPGKKVLTIDGMKNIRISDLNGRSQQVFPSGNAITAEQNGGWIMTRLGDSSKKLMLFNLINGKVFPIPATLADSQIAISADGKRLCAFGDGTHVYTYDFLNQQKTLLPGVPENVERAEFSSNGNLLLISFEHFGIVWDVTAGKWKSRRIYKKKGMELGFSPEGRNVLQFDSLAKTITIFDPSTAEKIARLLGYLKRDTYFSNDGKVIYLWENGQLNQIIPDLDIPPSLFKLQANVLTGNRLNAATGQVEAIDTRTWQILNAEYNTAAKKHLLECRYPSFNTWANMHPDNLVKKGLR